MLSVLTSDWDGRLHVHIDYPPFIEMNGHPASTDRRPGVSTVVSVTHIAVSADSHASVSLPSLSASARPIESESPVNKWVVAYERGRTKLVEDRQSMRKHK